MICKITGELSLKNDDICVACDWIRLTLVFGIIHREARAHNNSESAILRLRSLTDLPGEDDELLHCERVVSYPVIAAVRLSWDLALPFLLLVWCPKRSLHLRSLIMQQK